MSKQDRHGLFDFMLARVEDTMKVHLDDEPRAFGRWFANLFFLNPQDVFVSDGAKDGKIDLFFTTHNGKAVRHHVLNTKYTREFNKLAPNAFYQEIKYFWQAFEDRAARAAYLDKAVKAELRPRYKQLFERYDDGAAELMFVTNHRRNDDYAGQFDKVPVTIFHLDDLLQFLIDDIDGAMPRTPPLTLEGVNMILTPERADAEIPTAIIFARLIDFIRYMDDDPFDMLFNRNVRVAIGTAKSGVNRDIRETFERCPREFVFSNNGITLLCEKQNFDSGRRTLTLENPRVVNGSQTLHSIRNVPNPSHDARAMVRIIEIDQSRSDDLADGVQKKKDVIRKIAVRSNQQNPIKSWDLASNDDFQLELFRFFRGKGLYYERRLREWSQRSRELKNINISYGTTIKPLTQLIASYHWTDPKLGPALAKKEVGNLFEGAAYDKICQTKPELAYQLYMIDDNMHECQQDLAAQKASIRKMKNNGRLALVAIATRAIKALGVKMGDDAFTTLLEGQWDEEYHPARFRIWKAFTKVCLDRLLKAFKARSVLYAREEGVPLTFSNFFRSQQFMAEMLQEPLGRDIKKCAKAVLDC